MSTHYLDASTVVKRYLPESGSRWVTELWSQAQDFGLYSTALVDVEVICAFSRAQREGRIGLSRRNRLAGSFIMETQRDLNRIPVSGDILQDAHRLALRYPLRTYDAIHMATARELVKRMLWTGLPAPIFVSADTNLLAAARAEGLAVENPSEHE